MSNQEPTEAPTERVERCGAIGYGKGAVCVLAKGHDGYHTGPLHTWPGWKAKPGELRPFHDLWLLKAVLREALRDLEEGHNPPNIVTMSLERRMHNFRLGLTDDV